MSYAFYQASTFNQSLGGWRVQNVTDMSFMFFGAQAFNNGDTSPIYWNTSSVTNMQSMFHNAGAFNTDLSYFVGSSVTNISGMFTNALIFNHPSVSTWDVSNVTNMSECFNNAYTFNKDISGWNVSNVTNMSRCFNNAYAFNQNIGGWNVSNVTNMSGCFNNAPTFNQNIGGWNVSGVTNMTDMFNNSGLSAGNFDSILNGWAALPFLQISVVLGALNIHYTSAGLTSYNTLRSVPSSWNIIGAVYDSVPCFGEDTEILCYKDGQEMYIKIQHLRKGDLIKTCTKGYLPLFAVGHTIIKNDSQVETPNKLFICDNRDAFPEMTRPLILTGVHSLLYDSLTKTQQTTMMNLVNKIMVTENKYRLYACADDRVRVFDQDGFFDIYHIALENHDYYMNYGIYANGILVESCSKRYILEYSQMQIIS
jgi:surface protein